MTPRTPQVGDTITTAEELDALPAQAVFLADGHVWTWLGAEVRNPMRSPTGGAWTYPGDALRVYGTFTVLYLPGHPPRPEREVKAEALPLDTLDAIVEHLMSDGTRNGLIHANTLNEAFGRSARRLANHRIARGDH